MVFVKKLKNGRWATYISTSKGLQRIGVGTYKSMNEAEKSLWLHGFHVRRAKEVV